MQRRTKRWIALVVFVAAVVVGLVPAGPARGDVLSRARAQTQSASADASAVAAFVPLPVPVPGLESGLDVGVSETDAYPGGSGWDALRVGDVVLIGRRSTGGSVESAGLLAPAGSSIDSLNAKPCNAFSTATLCILLLNSNAYQEGGTGSFYRSYAEGSK